MPSAPVLKRYYKGLCTRCGRPCDAVVWCKRCSQAAADRGRHNVSGWWLADPEWFAYRRALLAWANCADTEPAYAVAWWGGTHGIGGQA